MFDQRLHLTPRFHAALLERVVCIQDFTHAAEIHHNPVNIGAHDIRRRMPGARHTHVHSFRASGEDDLLYFSHRLRQNVQTRFAANRSIRDQRYI